METHLRQGLPVRSTTIQPGTAADRATGRDHHAPVATNPETVLAGAHASAVSRTAAGSGVRSSSVTDPIAEAPDAVWYVRPPTGGQFGPADGTIMRRWLDEGRVSADALVWREGWPDWKSAGPVFPSLEASDLLVPVAASAVALDDGDDAFTFGQEQAAVSRTSTAGPREAGEAPRGDYRRAHHAVHCLDRGVRYGTSYEELTQRKGSRVL